jgi:flagella basal body P-ring formation protein FlgA
VLCLSQGKLSAVEIRLRSTATSGSSIVRLADVAEVIGEPQVASALTDVPLCPAPAAGQERKLSQEDVRQLLTLSGLERSDCVVTGSDFVALTGSSRAASGLPTRRPLIASGVRQAVFEADINAKQRPQRAKPMPPVIEPPAPAAVPLVERNATVSVSARTAGVRISTSGKALEAGKAGDTINVELADSKQRILATITGPQAVEVTDSSVSSAAVTKAR